MNNKKYYKVFEIDKCFEEYASDNVLVGAESVQDIFDHWQTIFPDSKEVISREDWMSDADWDDECEYGKYKEGDVKITPWFDDGQMNIFKESLDEDNNWKRIKEIPHLFTDTPYEFLISFGYIE